MKFLLILLTLVTACSSGGRRDGRWANKRNPGENPGVENQENTGPSESSHTGGNSGPEDPGYTPPAGVGPAPENPLYAYEIPNSDTEFTVNYGGPSHLIPGGLLHGMNDLRHSSDGAWRAWSKAVTPRGGVLRLWVRYEMKGFEQDHIVAARRAVDAGLTVMVTAVGTSGQAEDNVKGERYVLEAPSNPVAWADGVVSNVQSLRAENIPVTHIEIWNEPNLGEAWPGTPDSFGKFFALAGKRLREKLGHTLKIGGPGMAGTLGDKMEWVTAMFRNCKREGFQPDFYSWHRYGSYPTEHDMLDVPETLIRKAVAAGLEPIEVILSEWNIGLPKPNYPGLDDHRAANYYMSTVMALAQTPGTDAQFFFLQDAPWDTHKEFAGESVGVFSLAGAPKAVLSGMRMMATAADLPMVPMERTGGTSNINIFGSREGDRGYLLAVNTFGGGLERHGSIMMRAAGVHLNELKRETKTIKAYVSGKSNRSTVERLGFTDKILNALDTVREETVKQQKEMGKRDRRVRIKLQDGPRRIVSVQLLSEKHGNPIVDTDFLRAYRPFAKGLNTAAGNMTLEQLKSEGTDQATLDKLQAGMRQKQARIAGVDQATQRRARQLFDQKLAELASSVPETLAEHVAAKAQVVGKAAWCSLENGILDLRLPPETSVLVEFAW
ncbi:MAG: hypothetical protein GY747_01975 [Planctomycetes bacterium]|nr:hypothetical protein [Planctomycetota bacterium]MCP4769996.1 hypothetical protein [Planctomycetota bacterium]MCP4859836.1 hypothetical protein [Planctomycetota bacterium]